MKIFSGQLCLIFFIFISSAYITHFGNGASLGDTCTADNNCNSLANAECSRMFDCVTGTCACKSGYGNANGNACNKILSGFGEICGSAYYCNDANTECDSTTGRCACTSWYDYHTTARECVLRTYKILRESCGGWYNLQCLVALETSGGVCDGSHCTCQSGYVADTSESYTTCRQPRWGESCQWSPKCVVSFDTSTISDDTSSNVPTCTGGICTCPPSHEHQYVNGYHLCLNKVDDGFERYSIGENCTHFSECESFLCVKCPEAESGVCMQDSAAMSILHNFSVVWIVTLMNYVLVLFLLR